MTGADEESRRAMAARWKAYCVRRFEACKHGTYAVFPYMNIQQCDRCLAIRAYTPGQQPTTTFRLPDDDE